MECPEMVAVRIKNLQIAMEMEVALANRETNMGDWLSPHDRFCAELSNEIDGLVAIYEEKKNKQRGIQAILCNIVESGSCPLSTNLAIEALELLSQ